MRCVVKGCENEVVTKRLMVRDSGAARMEILLPLCGTCAAAVDAGNPPAAVDFAKMDETDVPVDSSAVLL